MRSGVDRQPLGDHLAHAQAGALLDALHQADDDRSSGRGAASIASRFVAQRLARDRDVDLLGAAHRLAEPRTWPAGCAAG